MTHEEIVTEIADELNIVASESIIRLGRLANQSYKRILVSVGMQPSVRAYAVSDATVVGDPTLTFDSMWKVTRIYYLNADGERIFPREVTWDELRFETTTPDSDDISKWALQTQDADSVTVLLDVSPETIFTVYADGYEAVSDLTDDIEPAFPSAFHPVIIDDVLRREYRKKEKAGERQDAKESYERLMGELRLWYAKSLMLDVRQGKLAQRRPWQI